MALSQLRSLHMKSIHVNFSKGLRKLFVCATFVLGSSSVFAGEKGAWAWVVA